MKKVLKLSSLLLVLLACFTLSACAPKDPAAAKEKLEKKEYEVAEDSVIIPAALRLLKVDGVESVLVASKDEEALVAIYFKDKASAKEAFDTVKEYAEKEDAENESKRSGQWIYYGSEQAMKDFA